jgi:hypothetical protein
MKEKGLFLRKLIRDIDDFPRFSLNELKDITLGTYQLTQSVSYVAEHMNENGKYLLEIHKENDPCLIRARISSRHVNRVKYHVYILYGSYETGVSAIKAYMCRCMV